MEKILLILILLVPVIVMAQPTIVFTPSDGITLTRADVDITLAENGLTRSSEFYAISDAICVGNSAFGSCNNLASVDFPLATTIEHFAFHLCSSLISVSFGTGFKIETEIQFGWAVFGDNGDNPPISAADINLTLGENVLPKPNLDSNTWQNARPGATNLPEYYEYFWKTISIYTAIKTEHQEVDIFYMDNNMYYLNGISKLELYNISGSILRTFNNIEMLDLSDLQNGIYFLVYTKNNKIRTKKIIID